MPAFFLNRPFAEQALLLAALASAALLGGAHLFEAFGYPPCPLCLDQREAHWAALGVAGAGLAAGLVFKARLAAAAAVGALALVYAASAVLAGYHTGVEFGFWPGPASCAAIGSGVADAGALLDALSAPVSSPSCTDAQWRLFGISMAGYNFLASAGLFALTGGAALAAVRKARAVRGGAASAA